MALTIRPVRADDRAELSRLIHALFPDNDDDLDAELDDYLSGRGSSAALYVAERADARLAGFIEISLRNYAEGCDSSPVPYIEAWYVDADVRRQGVGRALFAAAETWARDRGFVEIASDTELHNDISIAAHRALGYEETDRIVTFRKPLAP